MAKVYLVNTNKSNNPQNEIDMIENQKVSAYYSPWKYYIDEIEANDLVFLYSSNVGIIARGIATGIVELSDIGNEMDEEHYMHLNRFEVLERALSAADITSIVQNETDPKYKIMWNQTMIHIPYFLGIKIWQYITKYNL